MSGEEWRSLADRPGYEISSHGRLRSTRGGTTRIHAMYPDRGGYMRTSAGSDGAKLVHILVALAFLGPRPDGMHIRHLDGDQRNNRVDNLAYGTPSENARDIVRHGRNPNTNKTRCIQGHEYDEANTRISQGKRVCRACRRESARRASLRKKAAA
jgi:hypothetical protein